MSLGTADGHRTQVSRAILIALWKGCSRDRGETAKLGQPSAYTLSKSLVLMRGSRGSLQGNKPARDIGSGCNMAGKKGAVCGWLEPGLSARTAHKLDQDESRRH